MTDSSKEKTIKEKISKSLKNLNQDILFKKKLSDRTKLFYKNNPHIKKKISDGLKKAYENDPLLSVKNSEAIKRKHEIDPTYRQKLSNSHKGLKSGEKHHLFGIGHTETTKIKMSRAKQNMKWITNGIEIKMIKENEEIPEGWRHGRIKSNFKWITNGTLSLFKKSSEEIPEGWRYGRK